MMRLKQTLPWTNPLTVAHGLQDEVFALLYSNTQTSYSGGFSYLAWGLKQAVSGDSFATLETVLSTDQSLLQNAWFGYLGYDLKNDVEELTQDPPSIIELPNVWFAQFHHIAVFDHSKQTIALYSEYEASILPAIKAGKALPPAITKLSSNMSRAEYLQKVAEIIEAIKAGDLYQANLTRKFYGEFAETPHALSLFEMLCNVSPSPYSIYLRNRETAILSSSPERFLTISSDGEVTTRPIKGTARASSSPEDNARIADALFHSEKNRAENLMIVDLMRNDLSRACEISSIAVPSLFEITSHGTVHHMSSTVTARKKKEYTPLGVVKLCFPPGSMTGAPKIRAMEICSELESNGRGVYSGAIGWFGGDGSVDLSVVIRTLIIQGNRFEFQVGGGIVADSEPEDEWRETLTKARGIARAIGINEADLERL